MLNSMLRPSFLFPFALVTPYLFIGPVGVTLFETLLITAFIFITLQKGSFSIKPIIITYALLLFTGYCIAVVNADFNFDIPSKLGDLKIIYWLLLAIAGFHFGFRNCQSVIDIARSPVTKLTLIILGIFVASYPFLSDEIRFLVMRSYYHPDASRVNLGRIESIRFPGLGVNANTFAFMILIAYYMLLKAAFESRVSWIYPALGLMIITVTGSKTVMALSLLLAANILMFSRLPVKAKVISFSSPAVIVCIFLIYLFTTVSGQELQEKIVIIDRLLALTGESIGFEEDPLSHRFTLWQMGLERVNLSPFAGIAPSPIPDDHVIIHFCCPHNEFIAYWTFTGFMGLLAYIVLICGLILKNRSSPQGYFWIGLYLALCFQMFFDAAFQATRFIPLMFLMIGLNLRELENYRTELHPISLKQTKTKDVLNDI